MRYKWNDINEKIAIELYKKHLSCKEIGETLNCSSDTVRRKLKDLEIFVDTKNYLSKNELNNIILDYKDGMSPKELSLKYNRNDGYIINKLRSIGVYVDSRNNYTKEDEEFLIENYPSGNWDKLFERFPDTSKSSIHAKMSKMNIKSNYLNNWTDDELKIIKEYYLKVSMNELLSMLNYSRTEDAVSTKAFRKFGYSKDKKWSDEETKILTENYSKISIEEIGMLLPNRTQNSIAVRAALLGIPSKYSLDTYWSKEDTDLLLNIWNKYSDYELAKILGKTKRSIKTKRNLLELYRIDKNNKTYQSINKYIRGQNSEWKKDAMLYCNYKCILTGSKDFQIHHVYPVNRIINDIFTSLELSVKEFNLYTQEELNEIIAAFKIEQAKHPKGVCIRKDIHELYHHIYGKFSNNEKQWNMFLNEYKEGKYSNTKLVS